MTGTGVPKTIYVLIYKPDLYVYATSTHWEAIRNMTDNLVLANVRHGHYPDFLIRVFDNESGESCGEYVVEI